MTKCCLSRMDVVGYSHIYSADPKGVNTVISGISGSLKRIIDNFNKSSGTDYRIVFHQMYGDTLDIYFECGDADNILLLALVDITCIVQRKFMEKGLMVRGAIVQGDLIDTKYVFTGEAMIRAHMLELYVDSPHLVIDTPIRDMFVESIVPYLPNESDRSEYLQTTLYHGDRLDFYHHREFVIPDLEKHDDAWLENVRDAATNVSLKNIVDGRSKDTSDKLLAGLNEYIDSCIESAVN